MTTEPMLCRWGCAPGAAGCVSVYAPDIRCGGCGRPVAVEVHTAPRVYQYECRTCPTIQAMPLAVLVGNRGAHALLGLPWPSVTPDDATGEEGDD